MKKILMASMILAAIVVIAQDKSSIVVKESTVSTGVVIVTGEIAGKAVELQCTQSMSSCSMPKNGKYVMVQLPKNHGMYDCQNVDLYPDTGNAEAGQKVGQYCLIQK